MARDVNEVLEPRRRELQKTTGGFLEDLGGTLWSRRICDLLSDAPAGANCSDVNGSFFQAFGSYSFCLPHGPYSQRIGQVTSHWGGVYK